MGLKDRLAEKSARRVTLPIATREPTAEFEALQSAVVALSLHPEDGNPADLKKLVKARDAAQDAYNDCFVDVEFEALGADSYEKLLERHIDPDSDPDEELIGDWDVVLPELVATSCVDPELQDVEWWREQFAKPAWSAGDKITLRVQLVRLNTEIPIKAPKG